MKRIDIQEEVIVEALLNKGAIGLVISLKFAEKQGFKLKKIKRLIYMRNMNGFFNKEKSIEYIVKVKKNIEKEWRLMWLVSKSRMWF